MQRGWCGGKRRDVEQVPTTLCWSMNARVRVKCELSAKVQRASMGGGLVGSGAQSLLKAQMSKMPPLVYLSSMAIEALIPSNWMISSLTRLSTAVSFVGRAVVNSLLIVSRIEIRRFLAAGPWAAGDAVAGAAAAVVAGPGPAPAGAAGCLDAEIKAHFAAR